jgi:hypothetical protein
MAILLEDPAVGIHFSLLNLFDSRLVARDPASVAKSNIILTSSALNFFFTQSLIPNGILSYILLRASCSVSETTESHTGKSFSDGFQLVQDVPQRGQGEDEGHAEF